LKAIRERTLSVQALPLADPGRMIAVACSASRAAQLFAGDGAGATIAADNSPSASIISAPTATADAIVARAAAEGIEATVLDVSHAYHSPIIAGARPRYERALEALDFHTPACEIVSTITGTSIRTLPAQRYPKLLAQQFVQPVRLRQAIESLYAGGVRVFVECGPKWPLTTYIDDTLNGREHVAQPTMHPKIGEAEQLQRALARLFVVGATNLDTTSIHT
jgi:acyl transferase domain-containing protein